MTAKPLRRLSVPDLYWVDASGAVQEGNCSGLWGDCSHLSGDCSGLWGDCSGLWGNCSGLSGDCSGIPTNSRPCILGDWIEEL
jgi:hypothetical protein